MKIPADPTAGSCCSSSPPSGRLNLYSFHSSTAKFLWVKGRGLFGSCQSLSRAIRARSCLFFHPLPILPCSESHSCGLEDSGNVAFSHLVTYLLFLQAKVPLKAALQPLGVDWSLHSCRVGLRGGKAGVCEAAGLRSCAGFCDVCTRLSFESQLFNL